MYVYRGVLCGVGVDVLRLWCMYNQFVNVIGRAGMSKEPSEGFCPLSTDPAYGYFCGGL